MVFLFFALKKKKTAGVITDSQMLQRQCREILCTIHAVSPLVTSYVTVAQYQNQEIDIDTHPA